MARDLQCGVNIWFRFWRSRKIPATAPPPPPPLRSWSAFGDDGTILLLPPPPSESRRLLEITEEAQEIQEAQLGSSAITLFCQLPYPCITWPSVVHTSMFCSFVCKMIVVVRCSMDVHDSLWCFIQRASTHVSHSLEIILAYHYYRSCDFLAFTPMESSGHIWEHMQHLVACKNAVMVSSSFYVLKKSLFQTYKTIFITGIGWKL